MQRQGKYASITTEKLLGNPVFMGVQKEEFSIACYMCEMYT
jgi:hypothetical protein